MSDPGQVASDGGTGGPAGSGKPAPPQLPAMKPIHLFNLAGINVSLHPAWFLVLVYFIYTGKDDYRSPAWAGIECLGLFCIVLLHEFGHAFACRSTGGKADRIMLWPLGGVAYVQPPPRPGAFLWSIAAGPLVNVALIPVLSYSFRWGTMQPWAHEAPDLLRCVLALKQINMGLLMFNLLPVYPLDGGQIVQSLIWFVIGRAYSLMVVSIIGFAAAVAAGLAALQGGDAHGNVVIPYANLPINHTWCLFLALFMVQRSMQAFKYSKTLVQLERMRRVNGLACPSCGERPFADDLWVCDQCKANYNPFVTGNACPKCGKSHEQVQCPFCHESNDLARWRR